MTRERVSFFNDPDPMAPFWCMFVTMWRMAYYSPVVALPFYAPCLILMDVYKGADWVMNLTVTVIFVGCSIGSIIAFVKTFRQFGYI